MFFHKTPAPPFYLIPTSSPVLQRWRPWFDAIKLDQESEVRIIVPKSAFEDALSTQYVEMFLSLQHFPELLDRLVFNVHFYFEKSTQGGARYGDHEWKGEKGYKWFFQLSKVFPPAIFFLNDNDARFFSLMGDLIFHRMVPPMSLTKESPRTLREQYQMDVLSERFFSNACFFYNFCAGSNLDPSKYIDTLIADYGLSFTIEQVKEMCRKCVALGLPYGLLNE